MNIFLQIVVILGLFLFQINGQSTISSESDGGVCLNSCPWILEKMNENANGLKEYQQKYDELDRKLEENNQRLEMYEEKVDENGGQLVAYKEKLNETQDILENYKQTLYLNEKNLEEYKQKLELNEQKLNESEGRLKLLNDTVSELLEWKVKQDEERNGMAQVMTQVSDPSQTSITALTTRQPQTTDNTQSVVPKLNFPAEGYKVYYIAFLKNYREDYAKNSLLISSKNATSFHIYSRQPSFQGTYSIGTNGYTYLSNIPVQARVTQHATVTQQGILVNATDEIWVQGGNVRSGTLDGFNAIHVGPDSIEFLLIAYAKYAYNLQCGFVVVGTQDNTIVKVFKPVSGGGNELVVQTVINKLDTYAWYASEHEDVSGFKVTSDKPIAVYAGHPSGHLGHDIDHMVSSMPPANMLGTDYIVPPVAGVPGIEGYVLKIVANEDNTNVTIYRQTPLYNKELNEGGCFSFNITQSNIPLNVICSRPCILAQFSIGNSGLRIDSYMIVITPNSALSQNVRFGTLVDYQNRAFQNEYLVVISVNQTITSLKLDNQQFQPSWYPVPDRNEGSYFYSVTKIQSGFHHLSSTSTTGGFTAYVQGFNSPYYEGFGYRLGLF